MPPKSRTGAGVKKVRRKEKKNIAHGQAHITRFGAPSRWPGE